MFFYGTIGIRIKNDSLLEHLYILSLLLDAALACGG